MQNRNVLELTEEDSNLMTIWKLIIKIIKRMTAKRLVSLLQAMLANHEIYESEYDNVMELILDYVIEEYKDKGIKKKDLFDTKTRGETAIARRLCIIIIKEQLNMDYTLIANFFGRKTPVTVYQIIQDYENMINSNKNNPQLRSFLEKHAKVTAKILPKIEQIKKKQQEN